MPDSSPNPFVLEPRATCPMCGGDGDVRYDGLRDRLFGAPGQWRLRHCQRDACGCLWLDPRPDRATIGHAYTNYYTHGDPDDRPGLRRMVAAVQRQYLAHRYGYPSQRLPPIVSHAVGWLPMLHPGVRTYMDLQVMHLKAQPGGIVLDIGCGDGLIASQLSRLGWQVHGIEPDPVAAQRARDRGIAVETGTVESVSLEEGRFDAVVSCHVIEHLHDPHRFVREAWRLLKPGGRMMIVTPNPEGRLARQFGEDWVWLDPPRHLTLLTGRALETSARTAGFRESHVWTTVREANAQAYASRSIRRRGYAEYGRLPKMSERLRGQVIQYVTEALRCLGWAAGDELVLAATK